MAEREPELHPDVRKSERYTRSSLRQWKSARARELMGEEDMKSYDAREQAEVELEEMTPPNRQLPPPATEWEATKRALGAQRTLTGQKPASEAEWAKMRRDLSVAQWKEAKSTFGGEARKWANQMGPAGFYKAMQEEMGLREGPGLPNMVDTMGATLGLAAPLLYSPKLQEGEAVMAETPVMQALRLFGSAVGPVPTSEALWMIGEGMGLLDNDDREMPLLWEHDGNPVSRYWTQSMERIGRGEGIAEFTGGLAIGAGAPRGSLAHRTARDAGLLVDIAVPWTIPLTKAGRTARQFGRAAPIPGTNPRLTWGQSLRVAAGENLVPLAQEGVSLADNWAEITRAELEQGKPVSATPKVLERAQFMYDAQPLENRAHSWKTLVEGAKEGKAPFIDDMVDFTREAYRDLVRETYGDDMLHHAGTNSWVTAREKKRLIREVREEWGRGGVDLKSLSKRMLRGADGKARVTPDELGRIVQMGVDAGLDVTKEPWLGQLQEVVQDLDDPTNSPNPALRQYMDDNPDMSAYDAALEFHGDMLDMHPGTVRKVQDAMVDQAAGSAAHLRWGLRRQRWFADPMEKIVKNVMRLGGKDEMRIRASARNLVSKFVDKFLPDPSTARMPQDMAAAWREFKAGMYTIADDFVGDLRAYRAELKKNGGKFNLVNALAAMFNDELTIPLDIDLPVVASVEKLMAKPARLRTVQDIRGVQKQFTDHYRQFPDRVEPDLQPLFNPKLLPHEVLSLLGKYSVYRKNAIKTFAKQITAAFVGPLVNPMGLVLGRSTDGSTYNVGGPMINAQIWVAWQKGGPDAVRQVLDDVGAGKPLLTSEEAMIRFALMERTRRKLEKTMVSMEASGMAIPGTKEYALIREGVRKRLRNEDFIIDVFVGAPDFTGTAGREAGAYQLWLMQTSMKSPEQWKDLEKGIRRIGHITGQDMANFEAQKVPSRTIGKGLSRGLHRVTPDDAALVPESDLIKIPNEITGEMEFFVRNSGWAQDWVRAAEEGTELPLQRAAEERAAGVDAQKLDDLFAYDMGDVHSPKYQIWDLFNGKLIKDKMTLEQATEHLLANQDIHYQIEAMGSQRPVANFSRDGSYGNYGNMTYNYVGASPAEKRFLEGNPTGTAQAPGQPTTKKYMGIPMDEATRDVQWTDRGKVTMGGVRVTDTYISAQVDSIMQRYGVDKMTDATEGTLRRINAGGIVGFIPETLYKELEAAAQYGRIERSKYFTAKSLTNDSSALLMSANRIMKEFTIVGGGLPHLDNTAGNLFGNLMMLHQTLGISGMTGAMRQVARHPVTSFRLITSMVDNPVYQWFSQRGGDGNLLAKNGMVWTWEELRDGARGGGLDTSFPRAELQNRIDLDVQAMKEGAWWPKGRLAFRTAVRTGGADLAQAADNLFRVGAFLDTLYEGGSMTQALDVGRRSVLDYNAMTAWEKRTLRQVFWIYSFHRAAITETMRTARKNPHRLIQQAVMIEKAQKLWARDYEERGHEDKRALRPTLWMWPAGQAGVKMYSLTMQPVPPLEYLSLLLPILRKGDPMEFMDFMRRNIHPLAQMMLGYSLELDVRSGISHDADFWENIPPEYMYLDATLMGGIATSAFRIKTYKTKNPRSAANPTDPPKDWYTYRATVKPWWYQAVRKVLPLLGGSRTFGSSIPRAMRAAGMRLEGEETLDRSMDIMGLFGTVAPNRDQEAQARRALQELARDLEKETRKRRKRKDKP